MKFGVIIFPGSNCDHDAYWTVEQVLKQPVTFLWHESHDLENCDVIIVPGGFAYGDYLRTGAIAKFSPVMDSVHKFADGGGLVLGICNGLPTRPIGLLDALQTGHPRAVSPCLGWPGRSRDVSPCFLGPPTASAQNT